VFPVLIKDLLSCGGDEDSHLRMIFEMGFPAMADDAVAIWGYGPRTEAAHRAAPEPERIALL
jgi:hypothetical protein